MTWDRPYSPYSNSYPKGLDPFDMGAFAEGYARLRQPASPQVSARAETGLPPRPTPPEASPVQDEIPHQQATRKKAPNKPGKPPRLQNIVQKLRDLTLCRPREHDVASHCIQRQDASSRVASQAGLRIDRAQHSSASPDRVFVPPPGTEHEGEVDPQWLQVPTSPGTRSDWQVLGQSWAAYQDSDSFAAHGNAEPAMGEESSSWQPLSPFPFEQALHAWEEAEAAQVAFNPQQAGTSSQASEWDAFQAGPSSGPPAFPEWGNQGFSLPPQGHGHGMGMGVHAGTELMERIHADLFASPSIASVRRRRAVVPPVESTMDVDLKECVVINTARGDNDSIGTTGVATCFALCARGRNSEGETLLGLLHYTGDDDNGRIVPPDEALQQLHNRMNDAGARDVSVHIVGGMASPDPHLSTLHQEWQFLGLRDAFNIQGARLHVNSAEEIGEEAYVNVLMTRDQVYFSQNSLYDYD